MKQFIYVIFKKIVNGISIAYQALATLQQFSPIFNQKKDIQISYSTLQNETGTIKKKAQRRY